MNIITTFPEIGREAADLNKTIKNKNPEILELFTERGKRAFFPNHGIIKQSLEAKEFGSKFNASVGIALGDDGQPLVFDEMKRLFAAMQIPLKSVTYGSSHGLQSLRERLRNMLGIEGAGLPVITNGLTQALSNAAAMFCDENTAVVIHGFYWENIQLLFQNIFGSTFVTYPFYNAKKTGFNFDGLAESIEYAHLKLKKEKVVVYINFPNNPTGYNLTDQEGEMLRKTLAKVLEAHSALKIVVICDEAYFGLSYDDATKRAIMSFLVNAHPRLLTIAAKGPTKEVNVWGLRIGALYALPYGMDPEVIKAINEKLAGTTRGLISMPSTLGQEMVERIYLSEQYLQNLTVIKKIMECRAKKIKELLPLYFPFNSGYFCCFQVTGAEQIRQKLLKIGGGVITGCEYNDITLGGKEYIRLAFSCLPVDKIPQVLELIQSVLI